MDHQLHVGLVDTHAKGVGSHHHTHLVLLPVVLSFIFHHRIKASVIEGGCDTRLIQQVGKLLRALSAAGIDNCRTLHAVKDMQQLLPLVRRLSHHISQVLSLKAHAEHLEAAR